jgi:NADPH:quinone reductase-like Zn-dependent oxidoreductase/malonyl CoA-acyl carrier protein transacylase
MTQNEEHSRIDQVIISLPASVAIQLALVRLLQSWGIEPTGVTGHSSGEVAAAFAAGVINMREALAIVYTRGSLTTAFQEVIDRRGGMIAAGLSRDEAQPYMESLTEGKVVVACVNSPKSVTISGDLPAIDELEAILVKAKIFARRLRVDAAYHSHHMLGIAEAYHDALTGVLCGPSPTLNNGVIYSSPVTGDVLSSAPRIYSPEHWVQNMVQPVEFLDSLTNLCFASPSNTTEEQRQQVDIILEIGPHAALQSPIRQILSQPQLKGKDIPYMCCLRRGQGAVDTMQTLACSLLEAGYSVNLEAVNFPMGLEQPHILTDLPSYPWNHEISHWAESRTNMTLRKRKLPVHDLLGTPTLDSNPFARKWRHVIRPSEMPWVRDHQVQSNSVYPGAGYISMAIEGCRQAHEDSGNSGLPIARYELRRVEIVKALIVPETTNGVEVQLCLQPCGNGVLDSRWHQFQILSVDQNDNWSLQCEGQIMAVLATAGSSVETISEVLPRAKDNKNSLSHSAVGDGPNAEVQSLYKSLRNVGLNHGPIFQNITSVVKDGVKEGVSRSSCVFLIADSASTMPYNFQQRHVLHPTTLDSILQAAYTALPSPSGGKEHPAMLPRSIKSLSIAANVATQPATALLVKSSVTKFSVQGFKSNATISLEGSTAPMIEMQGLFCQSLGSSTAADVEGEQAQLCFTSVWKPDISFLGTQGIHQLQSISAGTTSNGHGSSDSIIRSTKHVSNGVNGVKKSNTLEATIAVIIEHLVHKNPRTHLLEIQGASGDLTELCLNALETIVPDVGTSPGLLKYTWTDRAAECIEAAQSRFAEYSALLTFQEHVAEEKSDNIADLVIMPLAAAKASISLLHDVVKPGGLVLAVDQQPATDGDINAARTWFGDDFKTIELDVSSARLVVAIKDDDRASVSQLTDILLIHAGPAPSQAWLRRLSDVLSGTSAKKNFAVESRTLDEIAHNSELARDRTVLVLDNGAHSVLFQPSTEQFEAIKSALVQAKDVLWVSRGGAVKSERPEASLAVGLLRTLRCEYPNKRYITLDLAIDSPSEISEADDVLKILATTLSQAADSNKDETIDFEYAVRNGLVHVARVSNDKQSNLLLDDSSQVDENIPFFNDDRNIRLGVGTPGLLDSLIFVDNDTVAGEIAPDQVQIKPAAFGLNFRDVMVAMGQLDETRMGFECSGTVVAIGSEAAAARGLEVGDRVFAFLRGYFANTIRVHHTSVARVPEGMDMETAASIPLVFITAYHALHNMARLKRRETILIHSGTGGVGQAAIMLAQLVKAEVFVTVGSQEKREFVAAKYGIPEDHIFNSRDASFASDIMEATQGKGVDVVLNSLAGALLAATWSCIAPFGRFIEIGKRDLEQNSSLEMAPFVRSVTFASLDLITLGELRGDIVADVFVQINALLRAGCINAVAPVTSFSITDAGKAFRTMQTGRHMGKIVLVPREKDIVKVSNHPYFWFYNGWSLTCGVGCAKIKSTSAIARSHLHDSWRSRRYWKIYCNLDGEQRGQEPRAPFQEHKLFERRDLRVVARPSRGQGRYNSY